MDTREIPFFINLNKLTIDELINLKKADEEHKLGGFKLDIVVSMYMQVPKSADNYWIKFFKDMKKIRVDPTKGEWFV